MPARINFAVRKENRFEMKKLVSILLVVAMLSVAIAAFADTALSTPSKTTEDMTSFEVTVENPVDGKAVTLKTVPENEKAAAELAKAQEAGSVEAYFGNETAAAINAILGSAEVSLDEFCAALEEGYEEGMGSVTVTVELPTPYEKDEKVAVLVGLVEGDAVTWKVFEGTGLEDGKVQLTLDAETALKLAAGPALFAVCSK